MESQNAEPWNPEGGTGVLDWIAIGFELLLTSGFCLACVWFGLDLNWLGCIGFAIDLYYIAVFRNLA